MFHKINSWKKNHKIQKQDIVKKKIFFLWSTYPLHSLFSMNLNEKKETKTVTSVNIIDFNERKKNPPGNIEYLKSFNWFYIWISSCYHLYSQFTEPNNLMYAYTINSCKLIIVLFVIIIKIRVVSVRHRMNEYALLDIIYLQVVLQQVNAYKIFRLTSRFKWPWVEGCIEKKSLFRTI